VSDNAAQIAWFLVGLIALTGALLAAFGISLAWIPCLVVVAIAEVVLMTWPKRGSYPR
jgi:hypothetical protein